MSLLNIAAKLLAQKVAGGGNLDISSITSALGGLLPTSGGDLDLGAIIGMMNNGGLTSLVSSFLGDGANDAFSPTQLLGMLGDSNVSSFASKLGLEKDTAANGLASMLPDLLDKSSSGGSLNEGLGGALASSVMSKLFS